MWLTYGSLTGKTTKMTLLFVTQYSSPIQCHSRKSLRTFLTELFSVSTLVDDPVIPRRVYKNFPFIVYQKVNSTDLVELEIVYFDVILCLSRL